MKVEEGVHLFLKVRRREEEEHTRLEAEEEARLVEEASLKSEEEEQARLRAYEEALLNINKYRTPSLPIIGS